MSLEDGNGVHRAIAKTNERIAALVRALPDTTLRVPGSDWTVGDTVAHIVTHLRLDARLVAGSTDTPFASAETFFTDRRARSAVNERLLKSCPEREAGHLADMLVAETQAFLASASRKSDGRPVRYHFLDVGLGTFSRLVLLHMLAHGYDIARARGRRFPIDPSDARLAVEGMTAALPSFVDKTGAKGLNACLEIRVRGGSRAFLLFEKGEVTVHSVAPRHVDCHISAAPVALLLVGMGRRSQWGPVAGGRLVAWGRNPVLALRLTKLFPSPG